MRLKLPEFLKYNDWDDGPFPVPAPPGWKSHDERLVLAFERIASALEAIAEDSQSSPEES